MNVTGLHWWSVNIGSCNGLVPSGNKPLPEPKLTQISFALWCHLATMCNGLPISQSWHIFIICGQLIKVTHVSFYLVGYGYAHVAYHRVYMWYRRELKVCSICKIEKDLTVIWPRSQDSPAGVTCAKNANNVMASVWITATLQNTLMYRIRTGNGLYRQHQTDAAQVLAQSGIFKGQVSLKGYALQRKTACPVYQHGLTLIPTWISNHVPSKCGAKLLIHFQTSKVAPMKFGNG